MFNKELEARVKSLEKFLGVEYETCYEKWYETWYAYGREHSYDYKSKEGLAIKLRTLMQYLNLEYNYIPSEQIPAKRKIIKRKLVRRKK